MLLNTKNNAVDEEHEHKTSMKTMISATEQSTMTTAYFDITELLAFLKTSPIVTGIQRLNSQTKCTTLWKWRDGKDLQPARFGRAY